MRDIAKFVKITKPQIGRLLRIMVEISGEGNIYLFSPEFGVARSIQDILHVGTRISSQVWTKKCCVPEYK